MKVRHCRHPDNGLQNSFMDFTRLCRQHLHCTPGNWISDLKIRAACRQLRSTRLSIAEIAARNGYATRSTSPASSKRRSASPP